MIVDPPFINMAGMKKGELILLRCGAVYEPKNRLAVSDSNIVDAPHSGHITSTSPVEVGRVGK